MQIHQHLCNLGRKSEHGIGIWEAKEELALKSYFLIIFSGLCTRNHVPSAVCHDVTYRPPSLPLEYIHAWNLIVFAYGLHELSLPAPPSWPGFQNSTYLSHARHPALCIPQNGSCSEKTWLPAGLGTQFSFTFKLGHLGKEDAGTCYCSTVEAGHSGIACN